MSSENSAITSMMMMYRKSLLLLSLFLLMFLLDALLVFFSPLIVFVIFLCVHAAVFFMWISARCAFVKKYIEHQSAVKNCAPEPEARREALDS